MIKHLTKTFCFALILFTFNTRAGSHSSSFQFPPGITSKDYLPNTLVLRVKPAYRAQCSNNGIELPQLHQLFNQIGVNKLFKLFPNHQPPAEAFDKYGRAYIDISLIYELEYQQTSDMPKLINSFMATGLLDYAEPKYIPTTQYIPNDPDITNQNFLSRIQAYAGWDISKGDTNVVIGINDTGSDIDHPDLAANLKRNYNDPINGADDDNDGYVDNFNGWDLGENDNNPTVNANTHGSHVSGCAAAVTDNGEGVASPGFNCKFLPIKISNANGSLTKGYEGIVYGADHGCNIINCSWGGGGGGSFGQNIIDYATINKDVLMVCAAGNANTRGIFYPAAFNNVLCIAATNSNNDGKASFSNHGNYVDVCAPGNGIYSTYYNNTYSSQSGTSMASPIAAGCAGIIKSYFPGYNASQVGELLRITADDIYGVSGNSVWQPLRELGTGRINLLNALTLTSSSVRMQPINIVDNNDNVFVVDDTLRITGNFTNYLDPTTNLIATISVASTPGNYVTILDNSTTIGALATMATTDNNADPFTVIVNPNAPQNAIITFKVVLNDGGYTDYVMFDVTVNVDYMNIPINEVLTTNTSIGRIGFNDYPNQLEGLGFDFIPHGNMAFEAGLMIGNAGDVSDVVRESGTADLDFASVNTIQKNEPGIWSDFDTYGKFNDTQAPAPLNIDVNYRSLSWTFAPDSRYHIFEYTIHNTGGSPLSSLYAGIFSDWDIEDYAHNKIAEDASLKMGYAWDTDSNLYAGIKVLTPTPWNHYAIDNIAGGGGGIDIQGGYSSALKYQSLSTSRATAGGAGIGNDVIDVVSTGPFNLNPGDSVRVAFALIAGESLSDLNTSALAAQTKYDIVTGIDEVGSSTGVFVSMIYPNPAIDMVNFNLFMDKAQQINISVFDVLGNKVVTVADGLKQAGQMNYTFSTVNWSKGVYLLKITGEDSEFNRKFVTGK